VRRGVREQACRLTTGNTRSAATTVEVPPTFVRIKLLERFSAPLSKINLVQRVAFPDFEFHGARDGFGSLKGAFKRAAVNLVKLHPFESLRQPLRL
jgi:hypothetical protein